ncbi:ABC transporter substrate-binding protein [Isoptericola sp. F-RaC21]|uniref:ABC transporter substrate-binding protein n=1 Tax=Isoptericola sp. F-RaC21 TaxID=3141452 RepID=UPI00315B5DAF
MTRRTTTARRRALALAAGGAGLALVLAACSDPDGEGGAGDETGSADSSAASIDCAAYDEFGDLDGKTVSVYTSIVDPEGATQEASYDAFEKCTGVTVKYEASREFEDQLLVRVKAGNAPDLAYLPQPGLLNTLVKDYPDAIKPAPDATAKNVDEFFNETWKGYGTVDGTFYSAPLGANAKSFVWYSPSMFSDAGYEVPQTWTELMDLTKKIHDDTGGQVWCAGVESGAATGWPGTDFIEDTMLRTAGVDEYNKWYKHEIPFNDPKVVKAWDTAGEILKNPDYVNAGLGGVDSIATQSWTDAGNGILDGNCWMHRAANFYQTQWPEGTEVSQDGDVFAFYLPTDQTDVKPMLGGGEFVAAFDDRPEVQAFQTYLSSADWANQKALNTPDGGWVSANSGLDPKNLATEFDQYVAGVLSDPDTVVAFDASDLMPTDATAAFLTGVVEWLTGSSTQQVTDQVESAWPK